MKVARNRIVDVVFVGLVLGILAVVGCASEDRYDTADTGMGASTKASSGCDVSDHENIGCGGLIFDHDMPPGGD